VRIFLLATKLRHQTTGLPEMMSKNNSDNDEDHNSPGVNLDSSLVGPSSTFATKGNEKLGVVVSDGVSRGISPVISGGGAQSNVGRGTIVVGKHGGGVDVSSGPGVDPLSNTDEDGDGDDGSSNSKKVTPVVHYEICLFFTTIKILSMYQNRVCQKWYPITRNMKMRTTTAHTVASP